VTPLVELPVGRWRQLLVKDETKQVSGAFKYRGIRHKIAAIAPGAPLVTASTGNHGAGLAIAARDHGCALHVFVPETTPRVKCLRMSRHGAMLHLVRGGYDDCADLAHRHADRHGMSYIHSFDDPEIVAGHQELFREVERVTEPPDVLFVPVGGGGLVSAAVEVWGRGPVRIIGVEHATAPAMLTSLAAGRRVTVAPGTGPAEGLMVRRVGAYPFEICAAHGLTVETVSDAEIQHALRALYRLAGIRAEYAGAAAVAAALRRGHPGQRALCVVSGGNIDNALWRGCVDGV
jgi:threonine dehydratase